MARLQLKKIEKIYPNGFKAVHGVDLEVRDGEFMVFVGPSGCAKSTLLRMIAGLEEPTQGTISLGTTDITYTKPYQRPINTVFQNYALFPHLTIFENIAFGLRRRGIKDVDDCVGTKNPFPFNRLEGDFNPLFSIICIIMGIIITIVSILNGILRLINGIRIPVIKARNTTANCSCRF